MSFSPSPASQPAPRKRRPLLKWGGVAVAGLAILGLFGSTAGSSEDSAAPAETVTVTSTTSAAPETLTTTKLVTSEITITEVAAPEPQEEPARELDDVAVVPAAVPDAPKPAAIPPAPAPAPAATYYANCPAVRDAGAAPIYAGDPGYSSKLDRDGDGIACE